MQLLQPTFSIFFHSEKDRVLADTCLFYAGKYEYIPQNVYKIRIFAKNIKYFCILDLTFMYFEV